MENGKYNQFSRAVMAVNSAVYSVEKWLAVLFMFGLVAVLFINVMCRYVLFIPSAWSEELGRYVFVWAVYLGSAAAMYRWEHIDINMIDSVIEKVFANNRELGEKVLAVIKKFAVLVTVCYLIFLLRQYGPFLKNVARIGTKSMFLPFKLTVPMSSVYICSFLMLFHAICYLIVPEKVFQENVKR